MADSMTNPDPFDLRGRVAVVTGAARGMGASHIRALAVSRAR
jgi:3alpha(or 20beta)-hydroxysteroid dehydrogenase